MGKAYNEELQQLATTMQWAAEQHIDLLRRAVELYCDRGLLAVGSGGSFTAAAFAAELHLRVFGRPSQAITPLECHVVPAASSALAVGLLLSAEGKNPDILAAAKQLQLRRCPAIGLTLRENSPLVNFCQGTGAASLAIYEMPWGKDGYLATNSLIATLILLWRAYATGEAFQAGFTALRQWYEDFPSRLVDLSAQVSPSSRALILHGVTGRIGAIDLESKLSEGALAFGQVCNFRQFAHGRHLQLHLTEAPITVVSFSTAGDPLALATLRLLPPSVGRVLQIALPSLDFAGRELAAVLAAFLIAQVWAGEHNDPGQPEVPQFGRDIHFLDVERLVREPLPASPVISLKRAQGETVDVVMGHARRYISRLSSAKLQALVCDFDGTFCDTVKRFEGLDAQIVPELIRLARSGIHLAFATGRGAKLANVLREKLPEEVWPQVTLGCYSGSHIFALDNDQAPAPAADVRLCELARWLTESRALPHAVVPKPDAGQLSIRGVPGAEKVRLIAAINEWISRMGCSGWRTFCSGHSIDVLTENAGKLLVVDQICKRLNIDPNAELLRLGDAGDFGGNDYELLSAGLALSVDAVPPGWAQCWNLLPRDLSGVRGTEHYLRAIETEGGVARFSPAFLEGAELAVREGFGRD